jgi:hypothetical protein
MIVFMCRHRRLAFRHAGLGYGVTHLCISHNIAHGVVIHYAQMTFAESLGQSQWYFSLGFYDLSLHFLRVSLHFLFLGNRHSPAFFGFRLGNLLICFSLIGLQTGTDITAYVDVGNIDGKNFKGCPGIKALTEDGLTDFIRIFQYLRMIRSRPDAGNNPFANTGNNRRFTGAAYETVDIGANRDAGPYL